MTACVLAYPIADTALAILRRWLALDRDYLMHRASELGVDDLLQKAVKEAELDSA
jgi:hypothetical protein